ncbi:MAG: 23S rRNA (adenine(2503)-C(2))-methyltransferase RlmN [Planctomycetes bacterium]|nr:23S rRNA (adenine(2503)-C(2))-methyltransferase RlmN [Planctomycetota bacterium]MBI3835176.1 23S rRNA (adenine(2503)-C(2))-methyltransferase RlmN [Planctomycetota bacterium]
MIRDPENGPQASHITQLPRDAESSFADSDSPTVALSTGAGFFDHTPQSLRELLASWKEPRFRVDQIFTWVYRDGAVEYGAMSNLPAKLRERLAGELPLFRSEVIQKQRSNDGTFKLLLCWPDAATSECVLIPDGERRTACISTQVGCPVGCVFCASGLGGLQRQLSPGEIIEQAVRVRQLCGSNARLSNIVFMGLGEPLANYRATLHAIRTINADWGLGIGARKITVSTVGLPLQIRRLADEKLQITLALSLHAPTDELRRKLIPWAERVTIEELIEACRYYFEQTGREVTLEYILLGGENDQTGHADALADIVHNMRGNVNLIPYNPVEGLPYLRPTDEAVNRFLSTLKGRSVNAHVRNSRGLDIDSACGQLRRRESSKPVTLGISSLANGPTK